MSSLLPLRCDTTRVTSRPIFDKSYFCHQNPAGARGVQKGCNIITLAAKTWLRRQMYHPLRKQRQTLPDTNIVTRNHDLKNKMKNRIRSTPTIIFEHVPASIQVNTGVNTIHGPRHASKHMRQYKRQYKRKYKSKTYVKTRANSRVNTRVNTRVNLRANTRVNARDNISE